MKLITIGRVTVDIELREGSKGGTYTKFSLAVPKGFGEKKHTVFLDVTAFHAEAKRLEAAKVKKGSQIQIVGDLDVVEFTRKDKSKGMSLEVRLLDWSYVSGGKNNEKQAEKEEKKPEYQERYCEDDDDLP
jgi:single-strand DNA-binding protein